VKPIVLSGFMGTGKTTIGARLAERLGVPFVDTDAAIERSTGKTVPQLWREEGEAAFRARELALVEQLLADPAPQVLAFGGGTVTVDRARQLATERALVVTLTASPETIVARTPDLAKRPNLALGGDPLARARELTAHRADVYAECHLAVSTDTLDRDGVVDAIMGLVARDPLLVPLGSRSYTIDVCDGQAQRLLDAVARLNATSLIVVTDTNVERARGATVDSALRELTVPKTRITLPAGEEHKTLGSVSSIWDVALAAGADREAVVVAVGGGVVGDLAGFAAACLLRGVRFVQVPTTLLSMVDASVGGKTGFDLALGKNLVGAFHQPSAVVVDLAHLETLPVREYKAGLAEIVKVALVADAPLLEKLESWATSLVRRDRGPLADVVRDAIAVKIRVIRDDEREWGNRALLNLGHTVGHALEAHGGYAKWLHGEAVALGLLVELRAMAAMGWTPPPLIARTRDLLSALGLPTEISSADLAAAWTYVMADKKRARDSVRFGVVRSAGDARVEKIALTSLRDAVFAAL
jgi:shikimate kinase/3-dehydroquinate synthase